MSYLGTINGGEYLEQLIKKESDRFLFNKINRRNSFSKFMFVKKLYMFRPFPLPCWFY